MEKFSSIKNLINYSDGGVFSKVLAKTAHGNSTLFSMAKGTEISDHTSTKEGIVYVLEGNGIFNLSGEKIKNQQ